MTILNQSGIDYYAQSHRSVIPITPSFNAPCDPRNVEGHTCLPIAPPNFFTGLNRKLNRLAEEQSAALKSAIYLGMSTEHAKAYDERRNRITKLLEKMQALIRAL
jgi:hypothetical protein